MPSTGWGRSLRRFSRRMLRRMVHQPEVDLVYTTAYARAHPSIPEDPLRGERILAFLEAEGLWDLEHLRDPRPAPVYSLQRIHTYEYLDSLLDQEILARSVGVAFGVAELDEFLEVQRAMVGGTTLAAALALSSGRLAVNLGGGLHHAWANKGRGFCLLNDVAVAIAAQRAHGFHGRVLVVDLDLHHGDGTEGIFAEDPTVYTYSVHNRPWSEIEAIASTNLALGDEVEDEAYLAAVKESLPRIFESFDPDLAFYVAGADPAATDTLGDWKISEEAMAERDLFVLDLLLGGSRKVPTVMVLAGGYGEEAWRYPARTLGAWLSRRRPPELPSTDEVTLLRYRLLTSMLSSADLSGPGPSTGNDDWGLSEEDLLGPLTGPARSNRFLDYYSKHGVELLFERTGLLQRLRDMGFPQVTLGWDLGSETGHTLRIFASPAKSMLLAELRVRRNRRLIPGMELLHVEWLLLQNPRQKFPEGRPPLPGQEHPGLGLLRDMVALLAVMSERIGLDGISYVPSHYHLAATSRKLMRFRDPEGAVELAAAQNALQGLGLAEASRAVAEGRVVDAETGEPFRWEPRPLVIPLSGRLKEWLERPEAQERRRAAEGAVGRYVLRP